MKVQFLRPATQEVDDAVAWYNNQKENLGREFLDDMDQSIRRIVAFPKSYQELEPGLRRCLLSRFPYGIIYGVEDETITVVAIAHLHRKPNYWTDRK